MSYYAQQQLQVDAAKQAQLMQREEEIKLEKKRREESALLGLDAYNLECTFLCLFFMYFMTNLLFLGSCIWQGSFFCRHTLLGC